MILTKEEFFKFDFIKVTKSELVFIRDEITNEERFIVREESYAPTLQFIEKAVEQKWIHLATSNKEFLMYQIDPEEPSL